MSRDLGIPYLLAIEKLLLKCHKDMKYYHRAIDFKTTIDTRLRYATLYVYVENAGGGRNTFRIMGQVERPRDSVRVKVCIG